MFECFLLETRQTYSLANKWYLGHFFFYLNKKGILLCKVLVWPSCMLALFNVWRFPSNIISDVIQKDSTQSWVRKGPWLHCLVMQVLKLFLWLEMSDVSIFNLNGAYDQIFQLTELILVCKGQLQLSLLLCLDQFLLW